MGSLISSDAKCHKEIKKRIAMGKEAFTKIKELLKGGLNRDITKRMVKALIWSLTLYGAETSTMRKENVKRIEVEMWIWRSMHKISWTEHRTNEEVLKKVEEKRSLIVIVIVNSKLLKHHSKAKRRAPAYSRALRQIRGVFQRIVRGRLRSVFQIVRECVKSEGFSKE